MPDAPAPDAPDRRERLLNLLALLLDTSAGATLEEIVTRPELGYPPGHEAARRAFERDKASLRAMGVPIHQSDPGEYRYRVDPREYYLPDLGLEREELAALHVAVTAVALGTASAEGALMKLGGREGGGTDNVARLPFEPALAPLFEARRHGAIARFGYHDVTRDLETHELVCRAGHWYVIGYDRTREREGVFRVDRIQTDVTVGEPGAFDPGLAGSTHRPISTGQDRLRMRPWQFGPGDPVAVTVRVDVADRGAIQEVFGPDAHISDEHAGSVTVSLDVRDRAGFRDALFELGEHAEVVEPPDLRAEIVAWLDAVVDAGT